MVNQATGEGISQALRSGRLAAEHVAAVIGGADEEARQRAYGPALRRAFVPGIWAGIGVERILSTPVPEGLAWLASREPVASALQTAIRVGLTGGTG